MKKLITILFVCGLIFSSCQKCVECSSDLYNGEDFPMIEVCRDNFESKKDFNNYIDDMEDQDWDCKNDFWN